MEIWTISYYITKESETLTVLVSFLVVIEAVQSFHVDVKDIVDFFTRLKVEAQNAKHTAKMELINNIGKTLRDDLWQQMKAGSRLSIATSCFSIFCFDNEVNETTITEIARQHPYYFILRGSSLITDQVADNFEQIWEEYSKDTIRKII